MRRCGAVVGLTVAVVLSWAAPAGAHTVTGVRPTDFHSRVVSLVPRTTSVRVRLLDLGDRVELQNRGDQPVHVIGADGKREQTVAPHSMVRWRDPRTRYEGPPVTGPTRVIATWAIALTVGEAPVTVTGVITYVPGPSPLPWAGAIVALAGLTTAAAWSRHWGRWLGGALAVLIASDGLQSLATAAATRDAIASQLGRVFIGGIAATAAWVVGALALPSLQRNHEGGLVAAGAVGLVIAAFSGVTDIGVLSHSQVASALPAVSARLAVLCALGIGVGLVSAAIAVIARDPALHPAVIANNDGNDP